METWQERLPCKQLDVNVPGADRSLLYAHSGDHVSKVRMQQKGVEKGIDVGSMTELDLVREVEAAAREPGRTYEGGVTPGLVQARTS